MDPTFAFAPSEQLVALSESSKGLSSDNANDSEYEDIERHKSSSNACSTGDQLNASAVSSEDEGKHNVAVSDNLGIRRSARERRNNPSLMRMSNVNAQKRERKLKMPKSAASIPSVDEKVSPVANSNERVIAPPENLDDMILETVKEEDLVREVSVSEAAAARDELMNSREMAEVLDFLITFREILRFKTALTGASLVDALVSSPGPGLLTDLHLELLRGLLPGSKNMSADNWTRYAAARLANEGAAAPYPGAFQPEQGHEASEYASLPAMSRLLVLKAICDMRVQMEDVHDKMEGPGGRPPGHKSNKHPGAQGRNPKAMKKPAKPVQVLLPLSSLRKAPYGVDGGGASYWIIADPCRIGVYMFKEGAAPAVKLPPLPEPSSGRGQKAGRGGRGREASAILEKSGPGRGRGRGRGRAAPPREAYVLPPAPEAGPWKLCACSLEELEAFGRELCSKRRKIDVELGNKILEELVPSLRQREEEVERQARLQARLRERRCILVEEGMGRSLRQRGQVCYRMDAYDQQMKEAMRLSEAGPAKRSKMDQDDHNGFADDPGASRGHGRSRMGNDSDHLEQPRRSLRTTRGGAVAVSEPSTSDEQDDLMEDESQPEDEEMGEQEVDEGEDHVAKEGDDDGEDQWSYGIEEGVEEEGDEEHEKYEAAEGEEIDDQ